MSWSTKAKNVIEPMRRAPRSPKRQAQLVRTLTSPAGRGAGCLVLAVVGALAPVGVTARAQAVNTQAPSAAAQPSKLAFSPPDISPHKRSFLQAGSTITFEAKEYPIEDAIPLLSAIVLDRQLDTKRRALAVDALRKLAEHPQARPLVPQLMRAFLQEADRELRGGLLMCLTRSEDERVPGLLLEVLRTEQDEVLRLVAAKGLAEWNVREGVAELIRLLGSSLHLPQRPLSDEAWIALERLSDSKGWAFPARELRDSLAPLAAEDRERALVMLQRRCEAWFRDNEQRFPEVPSELRDAWRELVECGAAGATTSTSAPAPPTVRELRAWLRASVRVAIETDAGVEVEWLRAGQRRCLEAHIELWTRPVDRLPVELLGSRGQDWYLASMRAFVYPSFAQAIESRPAESLAQRLELAVRHWLPRGVPEEQQTAVRRKRFEHAAATFEKEAGQRLGADFAKMLAEGRSLAFSRVNGIFCAGATILDEDHDWATLSRKVLDDLFPGGRPAAPLILDADVGATLHEALFWSAADDPGRPLKNENQCFAALRMYQLTVAQARQRLEGD